MTNERDDQVEIIEILKRCPKCWMATVVLVEYTYMTLSGDMVNVIARDEPEHSAEACNNMLTLSREQWPTLW